MKAYWYIRFLMVLVGGYAQAYVAGYARLYNPKLKKSVDVVYDLHISGWLSDYEFQTLPINQVKDRLYPTERYFLEALERINSSDNASSTALVCESHGRDVVGSRVFLGHLNSLIANRFQNITYIDADTVRTAIYSFESEPSLEMYKKHFPLSMDNIIQLILQAGHSSWSSYHNLYLGGCRICTQ